MITVTMLSITVLMGVLLMSLRSENRREYDAWRNMLKRCYDSETRAWPNYGGRGIKVCRRWRQSFENFLTDVGECKIGYSLERRNYNGHYTPGNCIWIPVAEQALNRRKAYNPKSGWQCGTLDDLFPPIDESMDIFTVPMSHSLDTHRDFAKQLPKWPVVMLGSSPFPWEPPVSLVQKPNGWYFIPSGSAALAYKGPFNSQDQALTWLEAA